MQNTVDELDKSARDEINYPRMTRMPCLLISVLGVIFAGCSDSASDAGVPELPDLAIGMASLAGKVVDTMGSPITGAALSIDETGETATTDSGGAFQLTVHGETTLSLRASASTYATTRLGAIKVAVGVAATGVEIVLMSQADVDARNTAAGGSSMIHGIIAVRVGKGASCTQDGATLAMNPPSAGVVSYASAADGGAPPSSIQADAKTAAFVDRVLPNATAYMLQLAKSGCTQAVPPVTTGMLTYVGSLPVSAGGVAQVTLFFQ